jgi:hypothetical protein
MSSIVKLRESRVQFSQGTSIDYEGYLMEADTGGARYSVSKALLAAM